MTHTALLLWASLALAGNKKVPLAGQEMWSAPMDRYEPAGSCPTCEGVRAFAVVNGVGWFLLHDTLVSTKGHEIGLPGPALDLAAGWSDQGPLLWALTEAGRTWVKDGRGHDQERQGVGRPIEISGDGNVRTSESVAGAPIRSPDQTPWAGGVLDLTVENGRATALWNGRELPFPGTDVLDARAVGALEDGSVVVVLTDSIDRSAISGVRFFRVGPRGPEPVGQGTWNGDVVLRLTRYYAADPADGSVWTLMNVGDRLSLRKYDLPKPAAE